MQGLLAFGKNPLRMTAPVVEDVNFGAVIRSEIHVFNHWCHLGTADSEDQLREILESPSLLSFDLDGYKILTRFLETKVQNSDFIHLLQPSRADRLV